LAVTMATPYSGRFVLLPIEIEIKAYQDQLAKNTISSKAASSFQKSLHRLLLVPYPQVRWVVSHKTLIPPPVSLNSEQYLISMFLSVVITETGCGLKFASGRSQTAAEGSGFPPDAPSVLHLLLIPQEGNHLTIVLLNLVDRIAQPLPST
ncbi:hypothetical protein HAX54_005037, partial [Datura stramonium]|nr:hypothetical protein [Datura stramonium]